MALKNLDWMTKQLIKSGLDGETPVILISKATTEEQYILETTLVSAAGEVKVSRLEAPAIVAIGDIVELRAALDPNATPKSRAAAARKIISNYKDKPLNISRENLSEAVHKAQTLIRVNLYGK